MHDGWDILSLSDIAEVSSGGTPSRSNNEYWDGNIPWVTTAEVNFGTIYDTKQKISQLGLEKSSAKLFPAGTILIAMYGQGKTRGQVAQLGIDATTNQACAAILLKQGFDSNYYYYFLESHYEKIRNLSNSGGQKNLSATLIKNISVPVPTLNEQKHIAEVILTWDNAIQSVEKLLGSKLTHKKALTQQLLSGKRRLPKFNKPWPEQRIGDHLLESRVPGGHGATAKKITVKLYGKGVYSKSDKREGSPNTKYYIRSAGQFIYSKLDFLNGAFGIIPESLDGYESTLDLPCFDVTDTIDVKFLLQLAKQKSFYSRFQSGAAGGRKARRVNPSEFLNTKLTFPPLKEQQAIVATLNCFEQEIELLKKKLDALKRQKQGLMQQLLTGRLLVTGKANANRRKRA